MGGVVVLGGLLVLIASFAVWVEADIPGLGPRQGTGWVNVRGNLSHGPLVAALGSFVVVLGVLALVGVTGRWLQLLTVLGGAALIGVACFEIYDVSNPGPSVTAEAGAGLWLMLGGGVVTTAAGMLLPAEHPAGRPSG